MKIFYSFIVFFLSITAFSQEYIPMLQEGNEWSVVFFDEFGPSSYVTYEYSGEELINGINYTVLSNENCRFREEDMKVYVYNPDTETEYIIYDFTFEVGDIVDLTYQGNTCLFVDGGFVDEMMVSSKSTQTIAGEDRIVLDFEAEGEYRESWIEGIGSTTGIYPNGWNIIDTGSLLTCFTKENTTYFFNDFTECNTLSTESFLNKQIFLYPNPVSKTSILQLPEALEINTIKIFDVSGRLVIEEIILKDYYTIDAMQYSSGLYFYQILSEGNVLKTDRFIIK